MEPRPYRRKMKDGEVYGDWTVLEAYIEDTPYAMCRCKCGTVKRVKRCHLKNGASRGCRKCAASKSYETRPVTERKSYIDGRTKEPLYHIWWSIRGRCYNPKHVSYHSYGARGIKICDEWLDYANFREWALSNGWNESLQIDRIDNDCDYCPENCRFVTPKQNCNNRRNNRLLTYDGMTLTTTQWADLKGWTPNVIWCRLKMGWSVERTLTEPPHRRK